MAEIYFIWNKKWKYRLNLFAKNIV